MLIYIWEYRTLLGARDSNIPDQSFRNGNEMIRKYWSRNQNSRTYSGIVPFRKLENFPEAHVLETGKILKPGKIPEQVPKTGKNSTFWKPENITEFSSFRNAFWNVVPGNFPEWKGKRFPVIFRMETRTGIPVETLLGAFSTAFECELRNTFHDLNT